MRPEDLKIHELIEEPALYPLRIHKEWVIDNAILRKFSDKIITQVVKIRMEYLAQEAKLAGKMMEQQAKMFQDIAEVIGGKV